MASFSVSASCVDMLAFSTAADCRKWKGVESESGGYDDDVMGVGLCGVCDCPET